MSWWNFSRAKAPAASRSGFSAQLLSSQPSRGMRRTTAQLLAAYETHPWLRQVVNRISYSVASVPWEVEKASSAAGVRALGPGRGMESMKRARREMRAAGELEDVESHPMLDLMNGGNAAFDGVSLRQVTTMQIDLTGESFWMPEWNGAGQPTSVWPISPAWVREVPRWTDKSGVYKVRMPDTAVEVDIPANLLVWLRDPSPLTPYGRGSGFGASLDDEIDADQSAARHIRGFFVNNAIPPLIAFVEGLQPDQIADFEEKWLSKTQGAEKFRRPIFTGTKFDIKELSAKFSDMELVDLRRFLGDVFQEVYGIPPEILGKVRDSNRSTIDAASTIFATYCLVPRLERLKSAYQSLADRYNEGLVVSYDSPIPEDREYKLKVYVQAPYAFTVDEWRELAGEDPMEDMAEGEERYAPVNTRPIDEVPAVADPSMPTPAPAPDAPPPEDVQEDAATAVLHAAQAALDPQLIRDVVKSAASTRKINARTRSELRHAILAGAKSGTSRERAARVFDSAITSRASGIASKEGDPSMKAGLRIAFAEQRRAVLAAMDGIATPRAAAG